MPFGHEKTLKSQYQVSDFMHQNTHGSTDSFDISFEPSAVLVGHVSSRTSGIQECHQ